MKYKTESSVSYLNVSTVNHLKDLVHHLYNLDTINMTESSIEPSSPSNHHHVTPNDQQVLQDFDTIVTPLT